LAKSKLDKFKDVLAEASSFLGIVFVGTEVGQYAQEDVDAFASIVESARLVSEDEGLEPSRYDEESATLTTAFAEFQQKAIVKAAPTAVTVSLRGTPSQLKGSHTIHFKQHIVTFVEGKVTVSQELADELSAAGYTE
jgi:hypothetical protein